MADLYSTKNGKKKIIQRFFGEEYYYFESEGVSSTTSGSPQDKINENTPSLPAGDYRISCQLELTNSDESKQSFATVDFDGSEIMSVVKPEMTDDDEYTTWSTFKKLTLTAGVKNFLVQFWADSKTAMIRRARVELWRVG